MSFDNLFQREAAIDDRFEAEAQLRNRKGAVLVIIPPDFSKVISESQNKDLLQTTDIELVGDLTNPYYTIAAVMAYTALWCAVIDCTVLSFTVQHCGVL